MGGVHRRGPHNSERRAGGEVVKQPLGDWELNSTRSNTILPTPRLIREAQGPGVMRFFWTPASQYGNHGFVGM